MLGPAYHEYTRSQREAIRQVEAQLVVLDDRLRDVWAEYNRLQDTKRRLYTERRALRAQIIALRKGLVPNGGSSQKQALLPDDQEVIARG